MVADIARIQRMRELTDAYLNAELAWQAGSNVEDQVRRDDLRDELNALIREPASMNASALTPDSA